MPEPTKPSQPPQAIKAVGLCFGFGMALAVEIYALGILAGGWLDTRFNTAPWCMLAGTLLAIFLAFGQLLLGLDLWNKRDTHNNNNPLNGEDKRA